MISYAQIYIFLRKMGGYFLGFEFSRWVMLEGSGFIWLNTLLKMPL